MRSHSRKLYSVSSIVRLEQIAIEQFGIPAYELMKRAGQAVFQLIKSEHTACHNILVLCGAGNNAGDGYVVAKLLFDAGYRVAVISLIDPEKLAGAAGDAYADWKSVSANADTDLSAIDQADLVVDALLGTGLKRDLDETWAGWIRAVNQHHSSSGIPVVAIDVPSGLYADTGAVSNADAIVADHTMTFIGFKQGLFTAEAGDYCGQIKLDQLGLDDDILAKVDADAELIFIDNCTSLKPRRLASNKGNFGHVLIAGGNRHMPGALILAASAALRTGAGKVTVLTIADHIDVIASAVPEAMILTCGPDASSIESVLTPEFVDGISHIAVGMGLGQDRWASNVLQHCLHSNRPLLVDADGLNLMAEQGVRPLQTVIMTPHPGEAGRLLKQKIQKDRFDAIKKLQNSLAPGSVVILKGYGTLIYDGLHMHVCGHGNPAMATAGMGDVLSGIVIGLLAQGMTMPEAADFGVCLHASIGDGLATGRSRGLLASDIVNALAEKLS
jgi:hydroxyethylthiazole kinase-like uncharacterized protein yjeF